MYIPKQFKKTIKRVFYDKKVEILEKKIIQDEEGGVISKGLELISFFYGNVNFANNKEIQEQYGLEFQVNVTITTETKTNIKIDDIIRFQGRIFKVVEVLPSDSYLLILGQKWHK